MAKTKRKIVNIKSQKNKLIYLALFLIIIVLLVLIFRLRPRGSQTKVEEVFNISLVRGVDVSRYQGDIDFFALYDQSIRFAFIKSTEGKEYIDPFYHVNYQRSKEAGIKTGAYHFFRFDVPGVDQARHFINHVQLEEEDLPPVIDLEFYDEYIHNPKNPEEVIRDLRDMVEIFADHYKKKPIIYTNVYVYNHYLSEDFKDVDYWYREIGSKLPRMPDGAQWTFWQYDDMAKLDGYGGPGANQHIDLNYFYGNLEDLEEYGRTNN